MTGFGTSLVRTFAGYLVAAVLSLPIAPALEHAAGVTDQQARTTLTAAAVLVLGSLYYAAARALERRWPAASVLLGAKSQPAYHKPPATGEDAESIATKLGLELVAPADGP